MHTLQLLDRLLMQQMGGRGNTEAHWFLQDIARYPLNSAEEAQYRMNSRRSNGLAQLFIPSKSKDRVIMFSDNSGVYVHSDGLCTLMGDISKEVGAWEKIK